VLCISNIFSVSILEFHVLLQIAAKINPTGTSESVGQKRPLEDGSGMYGTDKHIHRPSLQSAGIVLVIHVKLINGNVPDVAVMIQSGFV
jgi:hypothetical protein